MTENKLTYLGPLLLPGDKKRPDAADILRRLPVGFLVVVALPTLLAAIYYLFIASPRYVSEARFIVRAPAQSQVSALGVALQGVGFTNTSTDAFAVHEYISSRDGMLELNKRYDIASMLGRPGVDVFSRYPNPWEKTSKEGLHKGFSRFFTVGYASQTGISTLRVEAFRARDAQLLASALLEEGEGLVNRLNDRASTNAVAEAVVRRDEAGAKLAEAQRALANYRNREQFIDPARAAAESAQLIGGLLATLAELNAEKSQLLAEAPQSPLLPPVLSRIRAYEQQLQTERAKIAGSPNSLAPRVGEYELLVLNNEIADRELAAATAGLTSAEQEGRRQKLYLETIAAPSLPDEPAEPRRLMAILAVLATSLLIYGVGWLIWAGVREHRQD